MERNEDAVTTNNVEITQIDEPRDDSRKLLRLGVIGMGNCGGQMADMACSVLGLDAIAINASEKDLNMLTSDELIAITVGDGKGTGKNREEASEFLLEKIGILQDSTIENFIDSNDVIFVVSSMGGGFGSGSCLILADILTRMTDGNKAIIPTGVLPFDSEGYTAQNHAIEWLKELEEMDLPYIIYDNNLFANLPKADAHVRVNTQFLRDLMVIEGDFVGETTSGGIDNRDMLTTVSIPGRIVVDLIDGIDESTLVEKSITKTIQKDISEGAHAAMVEDQVIKASAYMYSLTSEFAPYVSCLKEEVQKIFGPHINDYDNFSDLGDYGPSADQRNIVSLILSGLSAPTLRINRVISLRDKLEKEINEKSAAAAKSRLSSTTSGGLKLSAKKFASENDGPKRNTSDFLADYMANRTGKKS